MHWHSHGYKIDVQGDTLPRDSIVLSDLLQSRPESGRTWNTVDDAVSWIRDEMWTRDPDKDPLLPKMMNPDAHPPAEELLERNLTFARDQLSRQQDVVWGQWIRGGRFVQLMVVCCPNRDGNNTCPTRY